MNEKGRILMVNVYALNVDNTYQRPAVMQKVSKISRDWSWIACGAITAVNRDGQMFVIDGQHRVLAARKANIGEIPCVLFNSESRKQEAIGFLDVNTFRTPITGEQRFKTQIVTEDETTLFVKSTLERLGVTLEKGKGANSPMSMSGFSWAVRNAKKDKYAFTIVMEIAAVMGIDTALKVRVLDAMIYFHKFASLPIDDTKVKSKIINLGMDVISNQIRKTVAINGRGSQLIYCQALLFLVNKGLRTKITLNQKGIR